MWLLWPLDFLPQLSYKIHGRDYSDRENLSICKFSDFSFKPKAFLSVPHMTASYSSSVDADFISLNSPCQGIRWHKSCPSETPAIPILRLHTEKLWYSREAAHKATQKMEFDKDKGILLVVNG